MPAIKSRTEAAEEKSKNEIVGKIKKLFNNDNDKNASIKIKQREFIRQELSKEEIAEECTVWLGHSHHIKSISFLITVLLLCFNLAVAINDTKQQLDYNLLVGDVDRTFWMGRIISTLQLLGAVGAIIYLSYRMLRLEMQMHNEIPEIVQHHMELDESERDNADDDSDSLSEAKVLFILPSELPACQPLSEHHDIYPTGSLIITSLLFAFFSCLSTGSGAVCNFVGYYSFEDRSNLLPLADACRYLLLTVFIIFQSAFFFRFGRLCVNVDIKSIIIPLTFVLSTNIACWFFTVGYEISHVIDQNNTKVHSSPCKKVDKLFVNALYPLLIEYYVMNALFSIGMILNAGCLAVLKQNGTELLAFLNRQKSDISFCSVSAIFRHVPGIAYGLIVIALSAVMYVLSHRFDKTMDIIQPKILLITHIIAIIALLILVISSWTVKNDSQKRIIQMHTIEVVPLWIANCAILVNDFQIITSIRFTDDSDKYGFSIDVPLSALNIIQSLVQTTILNGFLALRNGKLTNRLLFILMIINTFEWCTYTSYFENFFSDKPHERLVIAVITIPLLVFFRFHCISCFDQIRESNDCESSCNCFNERIAKKLFEKKESNKNIEE